MGIQHSQTKTNWRRVIIEGVEPSIDGGRFAVKRTVGEKVVVEADIFADGHDVISAALLFRAEASSHWAEALFEPLGNDRWRAEFEVSRLGRYVYTIEAWIDSFLSWRRDLKARADAGQDLSLAFRSGVELVRECTSRAAAADRQRLESAANALAGGGDVLDLALGTDLQELVARYPDRSSATRFDKELTVVVDRERARFGTWYEWFPRSYASTAGAHGTFRDCEKHLDYIAGMGFDVLYLPPIHPIGRSHRKGKNNVATASKTDPGSPWAIGAEEGGHKTVHPALGTLDDFRRFVDMAADRGMEVALDMAFQCAPDHPYVTDHAQWFRKRPDGSIQYAENPPKKYEDIYPIDFETADWRALWEELKSVLLFWIEQGVRIFRVDNPHTKPFAFWEWLIEEVKRDHPDVIFLAEAFTRPKIMHRLAKLGFTQSYTYFTWRNEKWELEQYFTELTRTLARDFFRPNLWPNTPDILHEYLQTGGRPAFAVRLVLAATLAASYGIYGAAFELCENVPREPGSEEYLNSEKYEIRCWNVDNVDSLRPLITRVNAIRKANPALQQNQNLRFHTVDNERVICYSKRTDDRSNAIITIVNLDPRDIQSGVVELDMAELGLGADQPYQLNDLLTGDRYAWNGARNNVRLDPADLPAHILSVEGDSGRAHG